MESEGRKKFLEKMEAYDLSEVHEVTSEPEDTASQLINRTIDWNDERTNNMRVFVDLSILLTGFCLNLVILVAILGKKRLHTTIGCYVLSLTVSNLVILLNVADDVVHHWFGIDLEPDLDFVGRVTLRASALTLVVFGLDGYITLCRVPSNWQKNVANLSTGVYAILIIWSFGPIATGMELNLYTHLRTGTVINIFCWSTAMYLLFPTFIFALLGSFVVLEFVEYRGMAKAWTGKNLENLRLLISLVSSFYVTMVPQRVVTILYYKAPQICCSPLTMNVCYYLAKVSSIVGPVICLGAFKALQRSVHEMVLCRLRRRERSISSRDNDEISRTDEGRIGGSDLHV